MRTYKAIDIARKVIARTDTEVGDSITNLKLQKLLYYLQGFWLATYNSPLFEEEIEAWTYGPVVPIVYDVFKKYGKEAIPTSKEGTDYILDTDEEERLFEEIYQLYNQFTASALVRMTHNETPWAMTEIGRGEVISQKTMLDYFRTQIE